MHVCLYLKLKENINSAQISIYLLASSRNTMFAVRKRFKSQFCPWPKNCSSLESLVNRLVHFMLLLQRFQWHMICKLPNTRKSIKSMIPSFVLSYTWEGIKVLEGDLRLNLLIWFWTSFPGVHPALGSPALIQHNQLPFCLFYMLGFLIKYNLQMMWILPNKNHCSGPPFSPVKL